MMIVLSRSRWLRLFCFGSLGGSDCVETSRLSPSTLSGFGLSSADWSVCESRGERGVVVIVYLFLSGNA